MVNKVTVGAFGWNGATDEYGDLLEMGVIDPVKVVCTALQNAAAWTITESVNARF